MSERRADLTGADKAVAETLDEVNARMHGLLSGGSYHREFLDWLARRGYRVVPAAPDYAAAASALKDHQRTLTPDGCTCGNWWRGKDGNTHHWQHQIDVTTAALAGPADDTTREAQP